MGGFWVGWPLASIGQHWPPALLYLLLKYKICPKVYLKEYSTLAKLLQIDPN